MLIIHLIVCLLILLSLWDVCLNAGFRVLLYVRNPMVIRLTNNQAVMLVYDGKETILHYYRNRMLVESWTYDFSYEAAKDLIGLLT